MRYSRYVRGKQHGKVKKLNDMTQGDFRKLKLFGWGTFKGKFDSLVIIPLNTIHDSGYRCMEFVPVSGGTPLGRVSGSSDVIHLDGIGGYGAHWLKRFQKVPDSVYPKAWAMDCLPKSGYLRLFAMSNGHHLEAGPGISSFEIFCEKDGDA